MPNPTVPEIDLPMSAGTAKVLAWVAWILVLIGTVTGAVAAFALVPQVWQQGASGVSVVAMLLAAEIRRRLPSAKALSTTVISGVLVMFLAGGLMTGCPNAHKAAWSTTAGLMHATQTTSKSLAAASQHSTEDHAVVCKRLIAYRDNIRPAARSAVAAAYAGIRIAQEAGKKPIDYIAVLRPGGCAIMMGLREWSHKLPDKGASILPLIDVFSGMACDKPSSVTAATAIVVALLPVVVDLVKWVVEIVGASNDDLQKSINKWIQGPATDEVDALIKTMGCV